MIEKLLVKGNQKLDKSIFCWAITPIKSCRNCAQCKKDCYALQPYKQYPCVKKAWDRNYDKAIDGSFVPAVIRQLATARSCKAVRIHVAGDFFSAEYVNNWFKIVELFKDIQFYAYTKVFDLFPKEISALHNLPNCNIINSITVDKGVNFGGSKRIEELKALDYFVCPVTRKNKVICGKDCNVCLTYDKVCFNIH